jgi:hypothetical protein
VNHDFAGKAKGNERALHSVFQSCYVNESLNATYLSKLK